MALERGKFTLDNGIGVYAYGPRSLNEAKADAGTVITPGMALVRGATAGTVAPAGAAATDVVGIADVRIVSGDGTGVGAYAVGEPVPFFDEIGVGVYMTLDSGLTITEGELLATAANGRLTTAGVAANTGAFRYKGKADVTTGAGATARILVERVM